MARHESSRFVQTLIREEGRTSNPSTGSTAAPIAPARMPAGAISRLIGAISRRAPEQESSSETVAVDSSTQTMTANMPPLLRSTKTMAMNQSSSNAPTGSYEVGEDTPSAFARFEQSSIPQSVAHIASATRATEPLRPSAEMTPSAVDEIRSAAKLTVSLPLVPPLNSPSQDRPIRNDAHPDANGGIRFAQGVDEIFDQVWVKVQRRISKPHQPEDDLQEAGIEHRNIQSIVVTSWAEDEGTSTVALGLAGRAANSMPGKICLVDADFLQRGLTRSSSLTGRPGLSDLVTQTATIDDVTVEGAGSPFVFIPAGTNSDPSVLSADARLQEVIRSLEERYRYVFYDVSSLKRGVEAYRWGRFVVNTILVVRAGASRRQTVRHAVDQIQLHGMDLLGTILNERIDVIPNWLYPYI
jgi:Mrp family chromosome partitioning ATPase